jgi:hypothetical protein
MIIVNVISIRNFSTANKPNSQAYGTSGFTAIATAAITRPFSAPTQPTDFLSTEILISSYDSFSGSYTSCRSDSFVSATVEAVSC